MKLSELIKELERRLQTIGDKEVECVHSSHAGCYKLVDVTLPEHRDVVIIVTQPVEWGYDTGNS